MFVFIKKEFVVAMTFTNFNLSNVDSLKCVSMNNQDCKIRPEIPILTLMIVFYLIVLK